MFGDLNLISVAGGSVKLTARKFLGKILLLDIVVFVVVGIFVAYPVTEFGSALVMGILQMHRYRKITRFLNGLH